MITRTAYIGLCLMILTFAANAQFFSYKEIEFTNQECQSFGLFETIDSLKSISIHETNGRSYSVVTVNYINGGKSEKFHLPIQFYDKLMTMKEKEMSGPITLLSKSGKYFHIITLLKKDIFGNTLTWRGFDIQVTDEDTTQSIKADDIERIFQVKQHSIKNRTYDPEDPSPYKLFLMPTGRAKEGFGLGISDHLVIFPGLNVSLPLNITLNGGWIPIGLYDHFNYWVAPKISLVNTDHFSLAFGSLTIFFEPIRRNDRFDESFEENTLNSDSPNLSYAVITVGNRIFSFTSGIMFERLTSDKILQKTTIHNEEIHYFYGAELKVSQGLKFMGEFLASDDKDRVGILGIRLYSESVSAEAGFMLLQDSRQIEMVSIPFACFTYYLK